MPPDPSRVGAVQMRIMRVLWRQGEATAREVTEVLSAEKPIAHSTVQTLLRKLENKGTVAHRATDRTFVFYPLVERDDVTGTAARELLDRIFEGSVYGLVAHLVKKERIDRRELKRIRRLIDEKEKGR